MMPAKDLKGAAFGRLSVISRIRIMGRPKGRPMWRCTCVCGATVFVCTPDLTRGRVRSCGCWQREGLAERNRQRRAHGQAIGAQTRTYRTWAAMLNRCRNNRKYYEHVTVCERWQSFENFLADMGERPPGRSIDRWPDPAGNYEPGNARWATPLQQRLNQRERELKSAA
jgi:hypothetical protein